LWGCVRHDQGAWNVNARTYSSAMPSHTVTNPFTGKDNVGRAMFCGADTGPANRIGLQIRGARIHGHPTAPGFSGPANANARGRVSTSFATIKFQCVGSPLLGKLVARAGIGGMLVQQQLSKCERPL